MDYAEILRERITTLRLEKNVSERKMSLELGKSGTYIRHITNGRALPSLKELFGIIDYFDMTPQEFFMPFTDHLSMRIQILEHMRELTEMELQLIDKLIVQIIELHHEAEKRK